MRSYKEKEPIGVVFINPSMTTYRFGNPSIRVFEADGDSMEIQDYF